VVPFDRVLRQGLEHCERAPAAGCDRRACSALGWAGTSADLSRKTTGRADATSEVYLVGLGLRLGQLRGPGTARNPSPERPDSGLDFWNLIFSAVVGELHAGYFGKAIDILRTALRRLALEHEGLIPTLCDTSVPLSFPNDLAALLVPVGPALPVKKRRAVTSNSVWNACLLPLPLKSRARPFICA
jgi:hypothetical protein